MSSYGRDIIKSAHMYIDIYIYIYICVFICILPVVEAHLGSYPKSCVQGVPP